MSATEAARIAAILPLPKKRGAIAPKGFTRRYGNTIAARIGVVARDNLDGCVYKGSTPPPKKTPPPVAKKVRPVPGAEFETAKALPPVRSEQADEPDETLVAPTTVEQMPPDEQPAQPEEPGNEV